MSRFRNRYATNLCALEIADDKMKEDWNYHNVLLGPYIGPFFLNFFYLTIYFVKDFAKIILLELVCLILSKLPGDLKLKIPTLLTPTLFSLYLHC